MTFLNFSIFVCIFIDVIMRLVVVKRGFTCSLVGKGGENKTFHKIRKFYENRTVGCSSAIILSAAVQGVTNPFKVMPFRTFPGQCVKYVNSLKSEIKIEKKAVYKE